MNTTKTDKSGLVKIIYVLIVAVVNSLYYVVLRVKVRRLRTMRRSQVMVSHDDIIYAFFPLAKTFSVRKKVLRDRLRAVFLFSRAASHVANVHCTSIS